MLIKLSRRTAICQSVAEVYLTGVATYLNLIYIVKFKETNLFEKLSIGTFQFRA